MGEGREESTVLCTSLCLLGEVGGLQPPLSVPAPGGNMQNWPFGKKPKGKSPVSSQTQQRKRSQTRSVAAGSESSIWWDTPERWEKYKMERVHYLHPNLKVGHCCINKLRRVLSCHGCRIFHGPRAWSNDMGTADGDNGMRKEGSPILAFHTYFLKLKVSDCPDHPSCPLLHTKSCQLYLPEPPRSCPPLSSPLPFLLADGICHLSLLPVQLTTLIHPPDRSAHGPSNTQLHSRPTLPLTASHWLQDKVQCCPAHSKNTTITE